MISCNDAEVCGPWSGFRLLECMDVVRNFYKKQKKLAER